MFLYKITVDDLDPHPNISVVMRWSTLHPDIEFDLVDINDAILEEEEMGDKSKFTFRFLHKSGDRADELGFIIVEDTGNGILYLKTEATTMSFVFPLVESESQSTLSLIAERFEYISSLLDDRLVQPVSTPPPR